MVINMSIEDNQLEHAKVGSWFLGPRAENFAVLDDLFKQVLDGQRQARQNLYSADPTFITKEMKDLSSYKESIDILGERVKDLSNELATHSVPFWSPRYNGHMNMDTSMASIIGYMSAMMYNPNNVATEASPLTTTYEKEVGDQLCRMLGYARPQATDKLPASWGHITCDGSVANLEAIWATRNLKFYPFSLKWAIQEGELKFLDTIEPAFKVETSEGHKKRFRDLSTWELLNLKPSTVLEIPTRLNDEYSISPSFLQDALREYLVQSKGQKVLEERYGIKPGKFLIGTTKHYSWPKGGAITGIGSDTFVDIQVDEDARMSVKDFKRQLENCLKDKIPVFGAVAIIGSTEHGACDPIAEMVQARTEFQARGLSFAIHCDAAWGGYFASMLHEVPPGRGEAPFVPALTLQPYTVKQLESLRYSDSITIDPHKSGYVNYPAGGLCYRDERMRYLVTWTSPIVFHAGDEVGSMGVYGVEGSKPGASAVSTWLTHRTIGLNKRGLGRLLGEAVFTCTKLYCHWATMTKPEDNLIVVPLIRLPSEKQGKSGADVEHEKQRIRDKILGVSNKNLYKDKETWAFLAELGGDLMINAFACNFKVDGVPNQDVGEANYLNQRIFEKTSVTSMKDKIEDRPLFLTSSLFEHKAYGKCLETLKKRLQLDDGSGPCPGARGDMSFLVNVTMSPWPTDPDFLQNVVNDFRNIANDAMNRCVKRNRLTPDIHGFVMQGLDRIYLVHIPMFHMANHRWQLIVTADYPAEVQKQYRELREKNPDKFYTTANVAKATLDDLLKNGDTEYRMDEGIPDDKTKPLATFKLTNLRIIIKRSIAYAALDDVYPDRMPFYLYGTHAEAHLDHVLRTRPNAQISADCVKLDLQLTDDQLDKGVVAVLDDVFERSLQPLPLVDNKNVKLDAAGLGLTPGSTHKATVYSTYDDFKSGQGKPIATGTIKLERSPFADWDDINMDGAGP
ncbi:L-tyrosine decarboxylase [Corynascus novoguineensis]|uniref:L-tyrosine decarboxylase n=1 Tax=Corynascus novoguineensis TaxID=1126955 RepID=A0AAN7CPS6_9PEZI|nr:L-tyrosine decarboxylase [Corynascus novoguineensis]